MTLMGAQVVSAEDMGQAKVIELKGSAMVMKGGSSDWMPLQEGAILQEGDSIKTGAESEARIELVGNKRTADVMVRAESEFKINALRHNAGTDTDTTQLDVEIGSVLVKAEKLVGDSRFEVKTPSSIVGIRGTTFEVIVS